MGVNFNHSKNKMHFEGMPQLLELRFRIWYIKKWNKEAKLLLDNYFMTILNFNQLYFL